MSRGDPIAAPAAAGKPSRSRLTLLMWAVVYPLLTAILFAGDPLIGSWPLPLRTLAVTAVLVPTLTYLVLPAAQRRLHGWLHAGPRH